LRRSARDTRHANTGLDKPTHRTAGAFSAHTFNLRGCSDALRGRARSRFATPVPVSPRAHGPCDVHQFDHGPLPSCCDIGFFHAVPFARTRTGTKLARLSGTLLLVVVSRVCVSLSNRRRVGRLGSLRAVGSDVALQLSLRACTPSSLLAGSARLSDCRAREETAAYDQWSTGEQLLARSFPPTASTAGCVGARRDHSNGSASAHRETGLRPRARLPPDGRLWRLCRSFPRQLEHCRHRNHIGGCR